MGSVPAPDGNEEVAAFLAELRAAYLTDPEEVVASRHLAAIAHEADLVLPRRTPKVASWRRTTNRSRFLRPVAALGAATLAAAFGTGGLAVAGVNLPDPATDAFENVGITLPNQAGGGESGEHSRSDDVRSVIEATPPSERGCAFGHSVAEAAKGSPLPEQARTACDRGNEAEGAGAAANTNSNHSQFGQDTAERARGFGDATVEERRDFGRDTSEHAKEQGGAPDGATVPDGRSGGPPDGTAAPEGTPTGPPEGTPDGPPDAAPVPDGTPTGPPDGTPGGGP